MARTSLRRSRGASIDPAVPDEPEIPIDPDPLETSLRQACSSLSIPWQEFAPLLKKEVPSHEQQADLAMKAELFVEMALKRMDDVAHSFEPGWPFFFPTDQSAQ